MGPNDCHNLPRMWLFDKFIAFGSQITNCNWVANQVCGHLESQVALCSLPFESFFNFWLALQCLRLVRHLSRVANDKYLTATRTPGRPLSEPQALNWTTITTAHWHASCCYRPPSATAVFSHLHLKLWSCQALASAHVLYILRFHSGPLPVVCFMSQPGQTLDVIFPLSIGRHNLCAFITSI